jgi:hypothetical protein
VVAVLALSKFKLNFTRPSQLSSALTSITQTENSATGVDNPDAVDSSENTNDWSQTGLYQLHLTSPISGSVFVPGQTLSITASSTATSTYRIRFQAVRILSDGTEKILYNVGGIAAGGSYLKNWKIPKTATSSDYYKVKAFFYKPNTNPLNVQATSERSFKVVLLNIQQPNGGESFIPIPGDVMNIKWASGKTGSAYRIKLDLIGGNNPISINLLPDSVTLGYYFWTIPSTIPAGSSYKVSARVVTTLGVDLIGYNDVSDQPFSIIPQISVSVSPASAFVQISKTQQLTAVVSGTSTADVAWSIDGDDGTKGSIDSSGLYTAPTAMPSFPVVVMATSQADTTKSGTATIIVIPVSISVSVSPATASVQVSKTQQFTATVTDSNNTAVTWSVSYGGGTINSIGLYTAPIAVPSFPAVVRATSQADTTKSGTATVTVTPVPISVSVSPATASIQISKTQQFTATVTGSNNTAVTWSVSGGGTINSSGLYTAPATVPSPNTVTVKATSQADTAKSGTATIIVIPILVSVNPTAVYVGIFKTQQFTATVSGTSNIAVTWSINGNDGTKGSISSSGLYTAPATVPSPNTVTVRATSQADTSKFAEAAIIITPYFIGLTSPKAGDSWQQGYAYNITWNSNNLPADSSITIKLKNISNLNTASLATVGSSANSYPWTIDYRVWPVASYKVILEVRDASNSLLTSFEGGTFNITAPNVSSVQIKIISPNGGETISKATGYLVTWTTTQIGPNYRINFLYNNGSGLYQLYDANGQPLIVDSIYASDSMYWSPFISPGTYKLVLTVLKNTTGIISDPSDNWFTITN